MFFSELALADWDGPIGSKTQYWQGLDLFYQQLNPIFNAAFSLVHSCPTEHLKRVDRSASHIQLQYAALPLKIDRIWPHLPNAFIRSKDAFTERIPSGDSQRHRWASVYLKTEIVFIERNARSLDVYWSLFFSPPALIPTQG